MDSRTAKAIRNMNRGKKVRISFSLTEGQVELLNVLAEGQEDNNVSKIVRYAIQDYAMNRVINKNSKNLVSRE